ncbi:hypothetical protein DH2020_049049 [Rehmannia glutinosa]|uniref:Transcription repressor n=1 Tax=Rehmannia glutinosa TaxID=99300 RepID=A0ABR0U3U3_REHGL
MIFSAVDPTTACDLRQQRRQTSSNANLRPRRPSRPRGATKDQMMILRRAISRFGNATRNFNSLYDANYSSDISTSKSLTFSSTTTTAAATTDDLFLSSSSDSDDIDSVPDFTSAFASHRFFFSSPGSSNSIIEPHPEPPPPQESGAVVSGGVAVQTYSPDPYSDFRKSMVEMIESRDLTDVRADNWGFLNELLLCYLTLNPKHTHKFIVGAFADVIVSLVLPAASSDDAGRKTHLLRHCATSHLSI